MKEGIEKVVTKEGKEVYLKKGLFSEYRVVYPWSNEDGSPNNFNRYLGGGWGYVLKAIAIVLIMLVFIYAYSHDTAICRNTLSHINDTCTYFCSNMFSADRSYNLSTINISAIT